MEGTIWSPRVGYYYEDIGSYRIEKRCYDANPCRHYVIDTENGSCKLMTGKDIFNILRDHEIVIPHFNYLEGRVWNFFCLSCYNSN
jgi:hypothetical protein